MGRAPPKSALPTDATPSRTTGFHDKMCHTASRQSNPPPLLHHLTAACALVAQMRTKSTARIVSYFCVRRCLLFTVKAHVLPPLLKIHEEESTRRCSSHCHFFEYLSPIPLLHHTLCSNDTKIQYMNIGCTFGHCGHITRRTSCYINQLSPFHSTRTHVSVKSVPTVLTLVRNPCLDHHLDHSPRLQNISKLFSYLGTWFSATHRLLTSTLPDTLNRALTIHPTSSVLEFFFSPKRQTSPSSPAQE